MQLQIQTSNFNMIPISDTQYLFDLARCTKCHMFIVLRATNKLYATTDDCSVIHEVDIPFLVNTDLIFRIDQIYGSESFDPFLMDQELFIPSKFNWVMIPSSYWDMYINGDIEPEYNPTKDQFILIDKTIKQPIDQVQMYKFRDCNDFNRFRFINQLEGFLERKRFLTEPEYIYGAENNIGIRQAFDNKVSAGRVLCNIETSRAPLYFYFYKGLFSLAKADTLELEVRFDKFMINEFMITFKPKKKRNPLKFNKYGVPFSEKIHCMYTNIADIKLWS